MGTEAARRKCCLRARGWLLALVVAGFLLAGVEGQYSFGVVFPEIGLDQLGFKDQPAVECTTYVYKGTLHAIPPPDLPCVIYCGVEHSHPLDFPNLCQGGIMRRPPPHSYLTQCVY